MPTYVALLNFTDQGIRTVRDTLDRADMAAQLAQQYGARIEQFYWTLGSYDIVLIIEAPDDETMSAFALKIGSLGSVKSHTMRAFRRNEMEKILAKIK